MDTELSTKLNMNRTQVKITKSSNIDQWIWIAQVSDEEVIHECCPDGGGNINPSSDFVIKILKLITGFKIQNVLIIENVGHYPGYAVNQINCNYPRGYDYNTKFRTPMELQIYIIEAVKVLREKKEENNDVQSVTFHIEGK